ncbi:MAG: sugar ABC transporter ATP-binding protein [Spirochaetaceae bacterium]|nr:sugar ABC transporter ATP-binding protein [Spirochaetaceae bacterium]
MRKICKSFPGVQALDNVDFSVNAGEIVGLLGENGAGKSTLMKVLSGVYIPNSGEIIWNNQKVNFHSIVDAQGKGISIIFQELNNCPNLNAVENLFLGHEIKTHSGIIDFKEMTKKAKDIFKKLDISVPLDVTTNKLPIAMQQMVEIAKALLTNVKLLIMDEPTSSLTDKEITKLFEVIRDLRKQGIGVIFISHKLDEVQKITSRIVVLRDGKNAGELVTAGTNQQQIVSLMVGREMADFFSKRTKAPSDEIMLRVKNLSGPPYIRNVSFDLRKGEILGFAGIIGAGRTETALLMIGAQKKTQGDIYIRNAKVDIESPASAIKHSIAYLSEDRKTKSLVLAMGLRENMTMAIHSHVKGPFFTISRKKEHDVVSRYVSLLDIKATGEDQPVANLSGGNQQKVVLAKWLATKPSILILDEPTRGIDVHAKAEVHRIITQLADEGNSIILISSELPEIIALSDRVAVMHEGRLLSIMDKEGITQEKIMSKIFSA